MTNNFTRKIALLATIATSANYALAQQSKDWTELKSARIAVSGDNFETIRKKVAEELEKAEVSQEIRERVLKEIDAVQLKVPDVRGKASEALKDVTRKIEQKFKFNDGKEQVEVRIDGSDSAKVPQALGGMLRARVVQDLDQKFRIGVACKSTSEDTNSDQEGLTVESVFPESPAFKAGIQEQDVLLSINGVELRTVGQLMKSVQQAGKDSKELELELLRSEKKLKIKVKPAELKDSDTDKLVQSLQLNMPPSGWVFNKQELDDLTDEGNNRMARVFAFSGNNDLKKEIEQLRKEIQELKEMIKELKNK